MKRITVNLNDKIKCRLTDRGKDIYYHQYDDLNKKLNWLPPIEPRYPDVDEDGFTKIQLWKFARIFGPHMGVGAPAIVENMCIVLTEWEEEDSEHEVHV